LAKIRIFNQRFLAKNKISNFLDFWHKLRIFPKVFLRSKKIDIFGEIFNFELLKLLLLLRLAARMNLKYSLNASLNLHPPRFALFGYFRQFRRARKMMLTTLALAHRQNYLKKASDVSAKIIDAVFFRRVQTSVQNLTL